MRYFSNWIVKKFVKSEKTTNSEFRKQVGYLEGASSIVVNLILFFVKLILGLISSSIALIADAFHTLSDISTSIIVIISSKIAQKPSDMEHPFGHQRAEAIATIIIATLLFVTGIELGKSAFNRIVHPAPFMSNWLIIGLISLTIIFKELLARFANNLGNLIQSSTLRADSWHHRSDAISTFLVLITFILGKFDIFIFDGYVGIVMSIFIMYTGFKVSKDAVNHLLGTAPEPEYINKVKELAVSIPEVSNVHDIILHQYGENKILSFHIEVPHSLSLNKAHLIAEDVERLIENELKTHTTVHFEPKKYGDPATDHIKHVIESEIDTNEKIESYHAFRTKGTTDETNVFFDLVVQQGLSKKEIEKIRKNMTEVIKQSSNNIKKVNIKIEAAFPIQSPIN